MRITQLATSTSLKFFAPMMFEKYGLHEYSDPNSPAVFFGMYNNKDFEIAKRHKSDAALVWAGNDSFAYLPNNFQKIKDLGFRHIAISEFISTDLDNFGIPHTYVPITPTKLVKNLKPRGDNVYAYVNVKRDNRYGLHLMDEISRKSGRNIIIADFKTYSKPQLEKIYESSFLGLRLTTHDGLPNTVVELGLMGRKCVYLGRLPNSIPYKDVNDIVSIINREYDKRHEDNSEIVDDMYNFLDIENSWLEI